MPSSPQGLAKVSLCGIRLDFDILYQEVEVGVERNDRLILFRRVEEAAQVIIAYGSGSFLHNSNSDWWYQLNTSLSTRRPQCHENGDVQESIRVEKEERRAR